MSPRTAPWLTVVLLAPATFLLPGVVLAPEAAAWQCMPDPEGVCAWVQDHVYLYARCIVSGSFGCMVIVMASPGGVMLTVCVDEHGPRVSHDRTCSAHGEGVVLP